MDKSVYSTEKISTGLAVSLETDQSSTRQFTILIRYLGAFDSLQEIAVFPIVPLLNRFAVGTASKEEILRLANMPEVLYIDRHGRWSTSRQYRQKTGLLHAFQCMTNRKAFYAAMVS